MIGICVSWKYETRYEVCKWTAEREKGKSRRR